MFKKKKIRTHTSSYASVYLLQNKPTTYFIGWGSIGQSSRTVAPSRGTVRVAAKVKKVTRNTLLL